ncbi:TonB-dependent receptor [Xanthomonas translucens pv. secalis]|uniref:TonB-dependent receptor n=1 Tax=Xanthomonas campestris pv. translucens TaxID=343 RepID=UPI001F38A83C|nr:carboxypeptidase regulatory-like domain-containing protein [Xanthomonas translucens]UKE42401.1 TonB-dependent receptor [Xanthomonas translucens pv. secalis]
MSNRPDRKAFKRTALAMILTASLAQGAVHAQSTTGSIFGSAPAPGTSIVIQSDTGFSRTVPIDSNGRYTLGSLPIGNYTVILRRGEETIDTRKNIQLHVGSATEVSFATANATTLEALTVTAASVPKIDVTGTSSRSVIASEQLDTLPLGRSAEAIALLAPGTVAGSGAFTNGSRSVVSFGGSGVTENAYYINGFNVSNPLSNLGGVSLPYGAIDQQETYTGGYSAKYGRSTGGVINQVGKRGTNEWHFGFQTTWAPDSLASSPRDIWYPSASLREDYGYENPDLAGTLYRKRKGDTETNTTYSAYAGGPLIEDKLFVFVAGESNKTDGVSTNDSTTSVKNSDGSTTSLRNHYNNSAPNFYGKIDWNINDSNILEYTRIQNTDRRAGYNTSFDYDTLSGGGRINLYPDSYKLTDTYDIFKYTGYLTDGLTLNATWARSRERDYRTNPAPSDLPYISSSSNQDPSITGATPITNNQSSTTVKNANAQNKTRGLRAELEYHIGNHDLTAGADNMYFNAYNEGVDTSGPGYLWIYSKASKPNAAIDPNLGVGAAGGNGYYVQKYIFNTATSMAVKQKAYYLEDRWQVNDKWLLSLGVRNDKFTNFNSSHVPYVDSGDQWAPRIGVSWDVFGDSSFKLFANLGRYYLALPNSVAIRGASASTYTREYFTYTGIDANGEPTGLAALGPGPVSSNGEYGETPDPNSFTPSDLKSQYQDELIIGFEKTIGDKWNSGAKVTYRKLQSAIDDVCGSDEMSSKLTSLGIDPDSVTIPGCVLFNPGETNTFKLANVDGSGYTTLKMSRSDWGFTDSAKRNYAAVDLFLEHPFDQKWYGRVDYTWSRSFGNTEGQVKSDIGQTDVSKTQDWDAASLMEYAGGYLANDRRHQLKAFGAYQFTPEWMLSATVKVASGMPKSCLGYYGTNEGNPISYGSAYHYCAGSPSSPGQAGRLPWTKLVDLGVTYRPAFADHKLAFGLQAFNVFNERKPVQIDATYETGRYTVSNTYGIGTYYTQPRYVRLSASYDF